MTCRGSARWAGLEEQDALDQPVGVLHLVDDSCIECSPKLLEAQFFSIRACRKYWLMA